MTRLLMIPLVILPACTTPSFQGLFPSPLDEPLEVAAETLDPTPPPPPPETARTVDEFDTTSEADRAEAVTVSAVSSEQVLGTTLATLGSPTEPGIWLKTPLVTALTPGRVTYQGQTINIELRPSGGEAGSGSQISLAAMRLLNAPLTGIIELQVSKTNG